MTLTTEKSEGISSQFHVLLEMVKKGNKDTLLTAAKLVENVMNSCANIIKPYMCNQVMDEI